MTNEQKLKFYQDYFGLAKTREAQDYAIERAHYYFNLIHDTKNWSE
jgi:dimeric dUTPase (all-alpha-NTP-PPase superfamily)